MNVFMKLGLVAVISLLGMGTRCLFAQEDIGREARSTKGSRLAEPAFLLDAQDGPRPSEKEERSPLLGWGIIIVGGYIIVYNTSLVHCANGACNVKLPRHKFRPQCPRCGTREQPR